MRNLGALILAAGASMRFGEPKQFLQFEGETLLRRVAKAAHEAACAPMFGVGWVQREGGPIEEIRPGDVVWFPPGLKHWHGASPTTALTLQSSIGMTARRFQTPASSSSANRIPAWMLSMCPAL